MPPNAHVNAKPCRKCLLHKEILMNLTKNRLAVAVLFGPSLLFALPSVASAQGGGEGGQVWGQGGKGGKAAANAAGQVGGGGQVGGKAGGKGGAYGGGNIAANVGGGGQGGGGLGQGIGKLVKGWTHQGIHGQELAA